MSNVTALFAPRPPVRHTPGTMVCLDCGAASTASCNCNAPYVRPGRRVDGVLAEHWNWTNARIAQHVGVDEATVRRARKRAIVAGSANAEGEPRRLGRDGKLYTAVHQQLAPAKPLKLYRHAKRKGLQKKPVTDKEHIIAFTRELSNFAGDFSIALITWLDRQPDLEPAGRVALASTLETFSMQLQRLAQRVEGR